MGLGDLTDPEAVLAAIEQYDELGKDLFLAHYGFGAARDWVLVHNGKQYDSKAIVGAAHGFQHRSQGPLTPGDFSAGRDTVAVHG